MPKMDSFELYDKIKKIDKKVKVFLISAFEVDRAALSKQYPGLKIENFRNQSKYLNQSKYI
jgi:hypothetical protein